MYNIDPLLTMSCDNQRRVAQECLNYRGRGKLHRCVSILFLVVNNAQVNTTVWSSPNKTMNDNVVITQWLERAHFSKFHFVKFCFDEDQDQDQDKNGPPYRWYRTFFVP